MPLTRWTHYRQTRAQKRKALHMLALSGVVRPSSIELRYTTPLFHRPAELAPQAFMAQPAIIQRALSVVPPHSLTSPAHASHLAHQIYSTAYTFLAESKRHLQRLQWDNRKTA